MYFFRFALPLLAAATIAGCATEPAKTEDKAADSAAVQQPAADTGKAAAGTTPATAEPGTAAPSIASGTASKPAPTEKPATTPTPKPKASKPATSELPDSEPATTANTASDPFSLVSLVQSSGEVLPTYGSDIDDAEISARNLSRWAGTSREYLGSYYGPLGSEISNVEVSPAGLGHVNLTIGYQSEVASDDGMIEQKQGEATARNLEPQGTIVQWSKLPRIYVTQGQFVQWTQAGRQERGLLVSGTATGKPSYVLLRKTKSR